MKCEQAERKRERAGAKRVRVCVCVCVCVCEREREREKERKREDRERCIPESKSATVGRFLMPSLDSKRDRMAAVRRHVTMNTQCVAEHGVGAALPNKTVCFCFKKKRMTARRVETDRK